jgi:hypothetical protein
MVGRAGILRKTDLRRYIDVALEFVATLPPK